MIDLENKIGYSFKDKNLLKMALTHSSFANENNEKSYERLEFLGDAVIELIVSDYGKEVEKLNIPYDYYDLTKVMFEFYTEDPFREKMITDARYQDFATKIMLINLMHNRNGYNPFKKYTKDEQELINIFLASASTDMFRQWVSSNKKVPMETVIKLTGRLLENGVSSMRN